MTSISTDTFDLTRLDLDIECDVGACTDTAAWLVRWVPEAFQVCPQTKPAELLCTNHFELIADSIRTDGLAWCRCPRVVGRMRALVKRIEPL